jgi:NAD(P)-dependent dehydrogenase (short-subunit alcohol dehydrogenase family)
VTILVFGATGALGSAIVDELISSENKVVKISRSTNSSADVSLDDPNWIARGLAAGPISGIVWAQGINSTGTVPEVELQDLRDAFEANVVFIVETLNQLLSSSALNENVRCVALSSIWQEHARPNKLAYIASKAALSGLIPALAIDLAKRGIAVNGVLPGVIDTPMTRAHLTREQIKNVENSTPNSQLAKPSDVARAVAWLVSDKSQGITGQWVTVDNGWSVFRNV